MNGPEGVAPELWQRLVGIARARAEGREPAHDFFHVERVVRNALVIAREEGADGAVSGIAALLHELVALPKSHPDSARAGDLCAIEARAVLLAEGAPHVEAISAAIRDHAFSKGAAPEAHEARVLQDADRLDALGAIGLARMWATCADMKRPFYEPDDPFCERRPPDDKVWGLDHVYKKLVRVPERLWFATSRAMARERIAFLERFLEQLKREIA